MTGYSNPAMGRMIGVPIEASIGRRLLEDAPGFSQGAELQAHLSSDATRHVSRGSRRENRAQP